MKTGVLTETVRVVLEPLAPAHGPHHPKTVYCKSRVAFPHPTAKPPDGPVAPRRCPGAEGEGPPLPRLLGCHGFGRSGRFLAATAT